MWELQRLTLDFCGLGGTSEYYSSLASPACLVLKSLGDTETDSEASVEQLAQLIRLSPSLRFLDLGNNDLRDLSASFIRAVISHPTPKMLDLSFNHRLGCSLYPSTPCAINRLLSELYLAGSSSPLILRHLALCGLEMTAECCGPALERVLSLGSNGLQNLFLYENLGLFSFNRTFTRTILYHNFYIQTLRVDGLHRLKWEEGEEGLKGKCWDTLESAMKRNKRLEKETHQAAIELLRLSRIVFLGSSAPSSCLARRPRHFRLLALPSELLQSVLSFVFPSSLSYRQVVSILRHAADRTTLLPRIVELGPALEQPALPRRTRAQSRLDLEARRRLPFAKKDEFLKETGCDRYNK